jgi:hypothetical protein
MARSILTQRDIDAVATSREAVPPKIANDYGTRVLKYIPAEVVTVFIGVQAVINQAGPVEASATLLWIAFGILLALTPVYLWRVTHVTKALQLVISTISFAVWVFSLGGPFVSFPWYQPLYGAVLLPLFTFAVGIVIPDRNPAS